MGEEMVKKKMKQITIPVMIILEREVSDIVKYPRGREKGKEKGNSRT